jgi:uncharacterized protein (DUF427 family)
MYQREELATSTLNNQCYWKTRLSYHIGFGGCKARRMVWLFHAVIIEVKSIEIDSGGNW